MVPNPFPGKTACGLLPEHSAPFHGRDLPVFCSGDAVLPFLRSFHRRKAATGGPPSRLFPLRTRCRAPYRFSSPRFRQSSRPLHGNTRAFLYRPSSAAGNRFRRTLLPPPLCPTLLRNAHRRSPPTACILPSPSLPVAPAYGRPTGLLPSPHGPSSATRHIIPPASPVFRPEHTGTPTANALRISPKKGCTRGIFRPDALRHNKKTHGTENFSPPCVFFCRTFFPFRRAFAARGNGLPLLSVWPFWQILVSAEAADRRSQGAIMAVSWACRSWARLSMAAEVQVRNWPSPISFRE